MVIVKNLWLLSTLKKIYRITKYCKELMVVIDFKENLQEYKVQVFVESLSCPRGPKTGGLVGTAASTCKALPHSESGATAKFVRPAQNGGARTNFVRRTRPHPPPRLKPTRFGGGALPTTPRGHPEVPHKASPHSELGGRTKAIAHPSRGPRGQSSSAGLRMGRGFARGLRVHF